MSGLVSGEAVVLELSPARVASRGLAFAIDATVQVLLLFGLITGAVLSTEALGGDEALAAATSLVAVVTAIVGYPLVLETTTRGRTLGKLAFGLRVVREDGSSVRFRHSLIRALFAVLELWATTGAIALIASLTSKDGKRLGDQFAGTLVIRERGPRSRDVAWPMPPRMAVWAGQADLARMPDTLALDVRTFLLRASQLDPAARWRTSVALADRVAAVTAPAPPAGVHPEEFLLAVLAERRARAAYGMTAAPTPTSSLAPAGSSWSGGSPTLAPPTSGTVAAPAAITAPVATESVTKAAPAGQGFVPPA